MTETWTEIATELAYYLNYIFKYLLPRIRMVRSGKNGDLHLKQIAYYKRTGEYHPTTLPSERSGIRRAAKKFVFKGKIKASDLEHRVNIDDSLYMFFCVWNPEHFCSNLLLLNNYQLN